MATKANKVFGRGIVQAHAAVAMTKHNVSVAKQGNKEDAIASLQKILGDAEATRSRQVINYLLNPVNAKEHPLKDLRERLKAGAKTSVKKAASARKTVKKASTRKASTKVAKPAAPATAQAA